MSVSISQIAAAAILISSAVCAQQSTSYVIDTAAQIDVPSSPFLLPSRAITVEAWVTYDDSTIPTGAGLYFPTICRHSDDPVNPSYIFRVEAGTSSNTLLRFFVNSQGFGLGAAEAAFAPGELAVPTHVAGTFDGQNYAIYINGVLRGSAAFPGVGTIVDGGGDLAIGNGGDGAFTTETTWNGEIDELRIWPFARTADEISETMNLALVSVPGGVTFNLDTPGAVVDSSQGLLGTVNGAVTFGPESMPLPLLALGGSVAGTVSTGCPQDLGVSLGSSSRAGNAAFEVVCYDGTPAATGGVLIAFGSPSAVPFSILGIDLHVDLLNLLPVVPPVTVDASGTARLPLSLANATPLDSFVTQFVFLDACGSMGLTSSAAAQLIVQ